MKRLQLLLAILIACVVALVATVIYVNLPAPKPPTRTVSGYLDEIVFIDTPLKEGAQLTYDAKDRDQPHYEAMIDGQWYRLTVNSGISLQSKSPDTWVTAEVIR